MQKRKAFRWPYTKKALSTFTSKQEQPSQMASILSKWYHNINELPLSKFIQVVVNQNIFALIIAGQPTQNDLLEAWEEICSGYEDAIGTNEHKLFSILFKEVAII